MTQWRCRTVGDLRKFLQEVDPSCDHMPVYFVDDASDDSTGHLCVARTVEFLNDGICLSNEILL